MTATVSADDRAFVASVAGSGRDSLRSLDGVRFGELSAGGRVDALVGFERLIGWAQAQQYRLMALMVDDPSGYGAVDGPDADREWAREDVQAALGISSVAAAAKLTHATDLVHDYPETLDGLEAGEVSGDKARVLCDALAVLPREVARRVQVQTLTEGASLPVPAFRRAVRAAVLAADPASAREQRRRGVEERRVVVRAEGPGVASLWALLPAEDAAALLAAVQQLADSPDSPDSAGSAGSCGREDPRTADQRRADALVRLGLDYLAGTTGTRTGGEGRGLRPAVAVTVALSTLLGLDEQCGELAGHGPIPAELARQLAADQTGSWRRLVTDERGVLLDYGRSTYRPPAALRRFIQGRDRSCRFPGCSQPSHRCEVDHLKRWEHGGETNASNLHALSGRHHHAKDDHGWRPTRRRDGATEWQTPTGHHYLVPAATYPIDGTMPESDSDPPPF